VAIVLWPGGAGPRVLLPHLALGTIFISVALRPTGLRNRWRRATVASLASLLVFSYASRFYAASRAPLPESYDQPEHSELIGFVKRETLPNAVFISIAPRTLSLLTRRTASIYDVRLSLEEQWKYFASIGATHLVLVRSSDERDIAYLARVIAAYRDRLRLQFSNHGYDVYRILPGAFSEYHRAS
jgi:hypothetical protein